LESSNTRGSWDIFTTSSTGVQARGPDLHADLARPSSASGVAVAAGESLAATTACGAVKYGSEKSTRRARWGCRDLVDVVRRGALEAAAVRRVVVLEVGRLGRLVGAEGQAPGRLERELVLGACVGGRSGRVGAAAHGSAPSLSPPQAGSASRPGRPGGEHAARPGHGRRDAIAGIPPVHDDTEVRMYIGIGTLIIIIILIIVLL
jgi:hypothetical protein